MANGQHLDHAEPGRPLLHTLAPLGHYSECKQGYCGACKVKLVKGQVRYLRAPMAFLRQDEILPCCCSPVGDIEIG